MLITGQVLRMPINSAPVCADEPSRKDVKTFGCHLPKKTVAAPMVQQRWRPQSGVQF